MKKVRWGILSTAGIGVNHVIPAMQQGEYCSVEAIASRSLEKAKSVANDIGIEKAYGSYEELLEDENIDAIYNPLPNHLHVPLTLKALEAGKHVLCEKPIALNAEEARVLLNETKKYPDLKVMEAFMYRFHPQWAKVKNLLKKEAIGEIKLVRSVFTYFNDDADDIRNKADIGGGGILDIGCYCISASRFIFEEEPIEVLGQVEFDPEFYTDRLASGLMKFQGGTASFSCSTQLYHEQSLTIYGTGGIIEMDIAFNPVDNPTKIILHKDDKQEVFDIDPANHYTRQGDLFSRAVLNNAEVPTSLEDAFNNMKVIDAIFESSKTKSWISI